tara:strand:+ start:7568 stop:8134 length:567 start_codon:yes stop_codon:yes gene_type:complete
MSNKKLELIYGCMFSGKTSKLIEIYNNLKDNNNCLAVNYILDKRYSNEDTIVSHNKVSINCYCCKDLQSLINKIEYENIKYDYIFINEGQFFKNLLKNILYIRDNLKINVIICGLNLDYERKQFGELMDLIPYSDKIHECKGKCNKCENKSLYSHRLIVNKNEQVLIGSSDEYIPLCEECWNKYNHNN